MPVVGLFAGIGGLEIGFAQAGLKSSLLADIDPSAQLILRAQFPNADIVGDVTDLPDLPADTSILTAGFPCQNLSMAGDKRGIGGIKSGVVSELFRLVRRSAVPTVIIENVYFMLHLDRGRAMNRLTAEFESLGYSWAYRVLDTMAFGLPQRRRRVFFIASRDRDPRKVLFADETEPLPSRMATRETPLGFYWTEGRSGVGITVDGIPPLKGGSGLGIPSAPAVLFPDGAVLMPSLDSCEKLQGFTPGWTTVGQKTLARKPEWRLLGNAVSVPVSRWLAQRIQAPGEMLDFKTSALNEGDRWPAAAYNLGPGRVSVDASDAPVRIPYQSIATFRDDHWKPLSDRALNGFIGRALEGGLKFPPGFLDAVKRAVGQKAAA